MTCPASSDRTARPATVRRPLSIWSQTSMRSYMRIVLCFPFNNASAADAGSHIRASLDRLACQRPDFAGTLEVGKMGGRPGFVFLRTSPGDGIPFELDDGEAFGYLSYDELRAADFPPAAFVRPHFSVPCVMEEGRTPVPVATVKAALIRGGLLLFVFFHHSFADGDCLRLFLETFAAQTRNEHVECPSDLKLATDGARPVRREAPAANNLDMLLERIPEYKLLDEPRGPTIPCLRADGAASVPVHRIPKTGKIFVFSNERLRELRAALDVDGDGDSDSLPSNYTCLAALTWAHVSKARLRDREYVPKGGPDTPAQLQTMVNWKSRAHRDAAKDYFGNATAVAITTRRTGQLLRACADLHELARLVRSVEATINAVDDDFVDRRTTFFESLSDPRLLGLRFDPRTAQDLGFNTWRHFGADIEWHIPGIKTVTPDVIRRAQDNWNMSSALILPARAASPVHELLVTLPQSSMELLCADREWMRWVERSI